MTGYDRDGFFPVVGGSVMADLVVVSVGDTVVLMVATELDEGLVRAARPGKVVARAARSL